MADVTTETPGVDVPPAPVGIGLRGWLRWAWRQLTSMRTALLLLFLVAVASIPGSLFPQRGVSPLRVTQFIADNPGLGRFFDALGMFDVFAAPWFAAVYVLLFVSLAGCVLPRVAVHWRAMRARPPAAPSRLSRLPEHHAWVTDMPPAQVLSAAEHHLRASRWRVRVEEGAVSAEKGYTRETGNLLFHLALLALLFAVAYGAVDGWRASVIVREGTGFSNTVTQYDSFTPGRLVDPQLIAPFSVRLDRLDVDFQRGGEQNGAPRDFAATVTSTTDPDAAPTPSVIRVNSPLEIDGAKVFLLGHGYAPRFTVTDAEGRVVWRDSVVFLPQDGMFSSTGVLKLPDVDRGLAFDGFFLPTAAIDPGRGPVSTFPAPDAPAVFLSAWRGDLGLDTGRPQSVYSLDTDGLDRLGTFALRVGEGWAIPGGGRITFDGVDRFGSFVVAYDPGKEPALIAVVLALLGLTLSLFVRRRRAWVRASVDGQGRTLVEVAGLARSEQPGLGPEIASLADHLRGSTTRTTAPSASEGT